MSSQIQIGTKEAEEAVKKLIVQFKELRDIINKQGEAGTKSTKKIVARFNELGSTFKKVIPVVMQYDKALKNMTKSQKSAFTQLRNTKAELKKLKKQLDATTAATKKSTTQFSRLKKTAGGGIFGGLKGGINSLLAAFGVLAGVQLFANAIKNAFQLTKTLDSLGFAMRAVITDAQELGQTQNWLRQITNDFGAAIVTTTNRYIKFRAASRQAGLSAQETQKIFGTFTKAAGVLGLKTEELQGIFLALEQMISKGKITTEELRRQLGERLPGAMDILANSLGVTTSELDAMLKKGEVITKEVLPGFAVEVEKAFGLDSVRTVETLQAATARLNNAWVNMIDDFNKSSGAGKKLMVIFDALAKSLPTVVKWVFRLGAALVIYKTAQKLSIIQDAIKLKLLRAQNRALAFHRLATINAAKATGTMTVAQAKLNLTMKAFVNIAKKNAVFLSIAIIIGLIAAYKELSKTIHETAKELNDLHLSQLDILEATKLQIDKVEKLGKSYERLSKIINPSKKEQKDLIDLATQIGKIYPGVIAETDRYGNAQKILIEVLKERIKLERQLLQDTATVAIQEQFGSLKKLTKQWDKYNEGLAFNVKGVGTVRKSADGLFRIFDTGTATIGGNAESMAQWTTTTAEQRKEIIKLVSSMQDAMLTSGELSKRIKELADPPKPTTVEGGVAPNFSEIEKVVPRLRKDLAGFEAEVVKLIKNGYDPLVKADVEALLLANKNIKKTQARITAITGETFALSGKAKKLREIKDLTEKILKLESKKITLELETIINDEGASFEDREQAASDLNARLIKNSEELRDKKIADARAVFEVESKGVGVERTGELDNELNQKIQLAQLDHDSEMIRIFIDFQNNKENIAVAGRDSTVKVLEAQFDKELLAARENTSERIANGEDINTVLQELADEEVQIQKDKAIKLLELFIKQQEFLRAQAEIAGFSEEALGAMDDRILKAEAALAGLKLPPPEEETVDEWKEELALLLDIFEEFAGAIGDIFASIFDRRIENIEAEINAEEEKYDELIGLAETNGLNDEVLRRNKEITIKKLEKERLKQQQKKAKADKAFAIADVQIKLGQTIVAIQLAAALQDVASLGVLGKIFRAIQIPLAIATAAAQTAAILAAPIPQFAKGGDIAIDTLGRINDAGVQEYIERGTEILTTTSKNAVIPLMAGDTIYKDYDEMSKKSMLMNGLYGGVAVEKTNFEVLFGSMENAIEKGFSKAKIVNNIKLIGFDPEHNAYKNDMTTWN